MAYGQNGETLHYVDLIPDGQQRQYTSPLDVKSVVTTPSGGQVLLDKGFYAISGLAWSGRGKVQRVDVSVNGGRHRRDRPRAAHLRRLARSARAALDLSQQRRSGLVGAGRRRGAQCPVVVTRWRRRC